MTAAVLLLLVMVLVGASVLVWSMRRWPEEPDVTARQRFERAMRRGMK